MLKCYCRKSVVDDVVAKIKLIFIEVNICYTTLFKTHKNREKKKIFK